MVPDLGETDQRMAPDLGESAKARQPDVSHGLDARALRVRSVIEIGGCTGPVLVATVYVITGSKIQKRDSDVAVTTT